MARWRFGPVLRIQGRDELIGTLARSPELDELEELDWAPEPEFEPPAGDVPLSVPPRDPPDGVPPRVVVCGALGRVGTLVVIGGGDGVGVVVTTGTVTVGGGTGSFGSGTVVEGSVGTGIVSASPCPAKAPMPARPTKPTIAAAVRILLQLGWAEMGCGLRKGFAVCRAKQNPE